MSRKSTVEEIRQRFDNDVERFSNLETGQTAAMDARLAMDLVARSAARTTPSATRLLDIGCGAGNYTLRLLQELPGLKEITLVDLSEPMLQRARQRICEQTTSATVVTHQADIRELELPAGGYDIVVAAAVLHHLRSDDEWQSVFRKIADSLAPGGSFWIFDMVTASSLQVEEVMQERYSEYLVGFRGEEYRDHVLAYIAAEDSPRPLMEQLDLLRASGLTGVDVLHKTGGFAAFGGVRPA